MEKLCLDTDVLIQIIHKDAGVFEKLVFLNKEYLFVTTAHNLFELLSGSYRKKSVEEEKQIEKLVFAMEILPLDTAAAKLSAKIFAGLISIGKENSVGDSIIAGICVHNHCELFTLNKKHFENIKGLNLV